MLYVSCKMENVNFGASLTAVVSMVDRFRIPLGVGVLALRLMPEKHREQLILGAIRIYKSRILKMLQNLATKNNVKVELQDIRIYGDGNMLEIGIIVDNLDYGSVLELVMPVLAKTLNNNPKLFFLNELLENPQILKKAISAMLDNIPEETKNHMVSSAVLSYQEEIITALNNVIRSNGVVADVSAINVEPKS